MSEKEKTAVQTITVEWATNITYKFEGVRLTNENKSFKSVWRGKFIGCAPNGLSCAQEYCIKQISVNINDYHDSKRYPACREYFDLFDFKGDHLRQILARNPRAIQVEKELRKNGKITESYPLCFVVEPAYQSPHEWFRNCDAKSVEARLDLNAQFAMGCQELRREENKVNGRTVDAHRDLKDANGVLDVVDGKLRVRLVDYASIHLNQETAAARSPIRRKSDATIGGVMSRQNTAPEDLKYTHWKVGATTDVYALGMMLASLFLRNQKGEYFNPNTQWIDWFWPRQPEDLEDKDKQIADAFYRCQKAFDKAENVDVPWIEQALQERGIVFRWEDLADEDILRSIRRLIVRATRIDPEQRISLDDYLEELQRIIAMSQTSRKKLPFSLYLFEQTDFEKYSSAYQRAASQVFLAEQDQARRKNEPYPRAVCVKYHRRLSGQPLEEGMPERKAGHCADEAELTDYIKSIPTINGKDADMTLYALLVGSIFTSDSKFYFPGRVHLFAREIPTEDQMEAVRLNGDILNIEQICDEINKAWKTQVTIEAHTILSCDEYSAMSAWCSHSQIQDTAQQQTQNVPEREETHKNQDDPSGGLYVILPDGRKFWL